MVEETGKHGRQKKLKEVRDWPFSASVSSSAIYFRYLQAAKLFNYLANAANS